MDQSIFKSYDVRGTYPDQLNEPTAFQVGKGFIKLTKAQKVAIGYDARLSSPELFKALTHGMVSEGAEVHFIGKLPTECLYFAVGKGNVDAGVMITASHNPKQYNGFKMILTPKLTGGHQMDMLRGKDLLASVQDGEIEDKESTTFKEESVLGEYTSFMLNSVKEEIKPFKVVVDTSNGVMGTVLEVMKGSLPVETIPLNFTPDGNFPNHSPNPLEVGSSDQIQVKIQEEKADFGIMFDGDADRVFLVDEKGKLVSADITLLLLAKQLLLKNPGSAIAYNAICSKAVPEFITKWGGVPVRTPVGFVNVREGVIKNNGVMGGELSGHYCFKDYFYMDSGMMAFLILLQVISNDGRKVSDMVKELSIYVKSAELNFEIEDKEAVLERLKNAYADGKQDFMDGVTVEYAAWWFNARPSNTEPLLRLTIEADNDEILEAKKKELSALIQQ